MPRAARWPFRVGFVVLPLGKGGQRSSSDIMIFGNDFVVDERFGQPLLEIFHTVRRGERGTNAHRCLVFGHNGAVRPSSVTNPSKAGTSVLFLASNSGGAIDGQRPLSVTPRERERYKTRMRK